MRLRPVLLAAALALCCHAAWAQSEPDKFLWLEDVNSPRALDWVRSQNAPTLARLQADPRYRTDYDIALTLAQDPDRIPIPQFIGGMVYNLWQDADHVQGIFRRTTLDSYRTAAPHWTTVLDLDALSRQEGHRWVFKAITCWQPEERRCLISLSDGGEDAVTTREYDMQLNRFVDGGFTLPRSKMVVAWLDGDTILAATDWGPGSLTHSGYPFIVKKLQRRQPLSAATTYFTAQSTDVGVRLESFSDGAGRNAVIIERELDFFRLETLLADPIQPTPLPLPQKLTVDGLTHGHLIVTLNEAFSTAGRMVPAGSIAALDLDHSSAPLQPIFTPGPRQSVDTAAATRDQVIAAVYDNVRGRAIAFTPTSQATGQTWTARTLPLPDNASVDVVDTSFRDNRVFLSVTSFLQPTSLYLADLATTDAPEKLKSLPARFDAAHEAVDQHEATSSDGTKIPYFVVHPQNMAADGINPTLLYAYGGFQISMTPTYNATLGRLWLEHGGVYVLANIRGGGEFGPAWHEAGLKTHRQRIYDDFAAVARDLIATHITSPAHLGIRGGSNGGLLMGVEFTQHPELYKAVIIDVPLLDMLRYEQIAAGASWVGEYGTVSDPTQRAFLASISPYNNLRLGVAYPEPFIFTTTKDDRVGPVHARKFAARLAELHRPYLYYEAIEGGHAAGANLKEKAQQQALEMTYLAEQLGVK
jgi:prolyl oligopeptidase